METDHINKLIILEETQSITKAADKIGISQPALSKLLKAIEAKLGVKLFYRLPKNIHPTKEGEVYLHTFKSILSNLNHAEKQISLLKNDLVDEFTLSIHPILGQSIIPRVEKKLSKTPLINLHYVFKNSREATKDVLDAKADFGIIADTQKYPDLIIKGLWKEYIGLYSYDGKLKEKILFNSNMIFSNRILAKTDFKYKQQVDDYSIIYSILKENQVMALLPSPIAESEKKLRLIDRYKPDISVSLIYRADKTKSKSFRKVVSAILNSSKT